MTSAPAPPSAGPAPVPKRRRISRCKRLVFVAVGLCLLAGFTELACYIGKVLSTELTLAEIRTEREFQRVTDVDVEEIEQPKEVLHPYLGWTRNPQSARPDLLEGRKFYPNDFGLMDEGSPIRKRKPGTVIVAVTGGSVAWQMSVSGDGALLRHLRNQPRFQGQEIKLVNLAVSGYKQPQQLLLLTYLLSLGAEFDMVINIDGYNETVLHPPENALSEIFPPYPRAWKRRQLVLVNPLLIRQMADYLATKESQRNWTRWFVGLPFQSSATVNFLWWSINDRCVKQISKQTPALLQGRLDHPGYHVLGPRQKFQNDREMFDYLVGYWAQCSRQMDRLCQANDIEYHHVLPPNQYLSGSKPQMSAREKTIALLDSEYGRAATTAYPLLVKKGGELRAQGLRFHDLTQLFSQLAQPIYVDNCCHYSPTGNERLAIAVAEILGKR